MNSSDEKLATALRGVAAASSQGAPAELGAKLQAEFHRYHARRRRIRRIQIGSAALCFSAIIVLLLVGMRPRHPAEIRANTQSWQSTIATMATPVAPVPKPVVITPVAAKTKKKKKTQSTDDFMILPSYDPAPVGDDLRIMRVELTGESLRRLGAPVTEELSDQRMKADVVVGTDGTPYAVRLVNGNY
ncbi:MAG: hypothetical protein DMG65_18130 [Candidatus Angelobacter sp. Gp1-AA117]|nr:MAG: hypothetical protein DMG65_18130 [Candidatus Angelobacter sp. Gp1-AA117]